jgi:hypothetical protein
MQQRYERQYAHYHNVPSHQHLSDDESPAHVSSSRTRNDSIASRISSSIAITSTARPERARAGSLSCTGCPKVETYSDNMPGPSVRPQIKVTEIEDLTGGFEIEDDDESLFSYTDDLCTPSKHPVCDPVQRRHCSNLLDRYRQVNYLTEPEEIGIVRDRDDEFQMLRHIILLLFLCSSMFVVS